MSNSTRTAGASHPSSSARDQTVGRADYGASHARAPTSSRTYRRRRLVRLSLMGADAIGLLVAFAASGMLHSGALLNSGDGSLSAIGWVAMVLRLPVALAIAASFGLYSYDEIRSTHPTAHELGRIFQFVATLALAEFLLESLGLTVIFRPSTARVVAFWVLAVLLIAILRSAARVFVRRMPAYVQRVVIIGSGPKVDRLVDVLRRERRLGMHVVGRVWTTDAPDRRRAGLTAEALPHLVNEIRRIRADRVIVVDGAGLRWDLETTVRGLYGLGVIIDIVPQVSEMFSMSVEMHDIEGTPLLAIPHPRLSRGAALTKRSFDLVIAGVMMLALAPLFVAVAWAIRRDSAGPAFYRQTRVGKRGREFGMFKFRTMVDGADSHRRALREMAATGNGAGNGNGASLFKMENDPRVTRVGRFLRRHSLDELPQLINVLLGQMSLVGPRPLIPEEDVQVRGWGMRRTATPPGMTGLWQVSGSNDIGFAEMVGLDYSYVSSWSVWGDVRVMLQTIPVVVGGSRVDR